ncbi:DUF1254 domain-containing protein [Paraflavitalea pollutisoli]|uniref:DUF1254 domain-containing protein n=1 Tax=Paraflavitalea pollutisoli TaxID=3034143 RepID=UPI0023EB4EDB|nr:DUF1254 domain-containing protein [Paraflavitalea sp. H1-2-19X]
MKQICFTIALIGLLLSCQQRNTSNAAIEIAPDSARAIAREAWTYGYPMFYNYRSIYLYALDKSYSDYAGGFNRFKHYAKSFTDTDTAVVTPNNDTPYSWAVVRTDEEPVVLEVPAIADNRYYVMQLVDLYTFNFAYVGTRATGNGPGKYLIAGPQWKGETPAGITRVMQSETNLVTILGRTQLSDASDLEKVKAIQQQYKLIPLHEYTGQAAPAKKDYPMPLPAWQEADYNAPGFIGVLNALLQYCSTDPSEEKLKAQFARLGIEAGKPFDSTNYSKETLAAIREGITLGKKDMETAIAQTTSSLGLFGSRAELGNNYLKRAIAAAMGLYGNNKEEAVYVGSLKDREGQQLVGERRYTLRFQGNQLPPVKFFWSITAYVLPQRYLVKNPIGRYSIGDRTPSLKRDPDGSLVIYLQSTSPGPGKEGNWLPTPQQGPFNYVLRLYGPGQEVMNGNWQQPLPQKVD